ncbi:MAG: efflux RND transporter periplasmic adaptor subunit [Deltaproteobacteria bacterium]|nr:efflux RND transporter periplasmic adaptor subunit [Deltaproteobacteria bacterium]
MKKYLYAGAFVLLLGITFLSGYWYSQRSSSESGSSAGRKVLYYADPMNPGHRYDQPGIAPCGMALEPVYADGGNGMPGMGATPPGTVLISPEKQQLIGVRVEPVEKGSGTRTIRVLGRVAADETRVYRINASVDGWIRKVFPVSTGSQIKKNAPLAYFYTPEFLTAQQAYISIMGSAASSLSTGKEGQYQISPIGTSLDKYRDILRNLGMTESQIDEIGRTRRITQDIEIRSPAQGFLLARNVSLDQRFEKGDELFRIADLRRVWILLDTYENESRYFRPGQQIMFRYQGKTFHARVSSVLPLFDPATRTLKVRLEADNPGYQLRPDMFVDVEHSVTMPPAITVPIEAVLDSGLKKTVFVERGPGLFEPREVETGKLYDNRVEIVEGLKPGERVVVSGNFLIDSESKMKSAAAGMSGTGSIDPACGMMVDEGRSRSAGLTSEFRGKTYYFCSAECKRDFDRSPGKHSGQPATGESPGQEMKNGGHRHD